MADQSKAIVDLEPYAIIAFDFDGVILDSNHFKTKLFAKVLGRHGYSQDQIFRFGEYQRANFGTSRYRLFELVLEGAFGPPPAVLQDKLLDDFGSLSRDEYERQAETPGMREALERAGRNGRSRFVVSGSDESELKGVAANLGLSACFDVIYGSPVKKHENLAKARLDHVRRGGSDEARMLFLGDAMADMQAAETVGADFVLVARFSSDRERVERRVLEQGWPIIEDLRQLK